MHAAVRRTMHAQELERRGMPIESFANQHDHIPAAAEIDERRIAVVSGRVERAVGNQPPQRQTKLHDAWWIAPPHADHARSGFHAFGRIDLQRHAVTDVLPPEPEIGREGNDEQQREEAGEKITNETPNAHGAHSFDPVRVVSGDGSRLRGWWGGRLIATAAPVIAAVALYVRDEPRRGPALFLQMRSCPRNSVPVTPWMLCGDLEVRNTKLCNSYFRSSLVVVHPAWSA
jgi:hypothetical protein